MAEVIGFIIFVGIGYAIYTLVFKEKKPKLPADRKPTAPRNRPPQNPKNPLD